VLDKLSVWRWARAAVSDDTGMKMVFIRCKLYTLELFSHPEINISFMCMY